MKEKYLINGFYKIKKCGCFTISKKTPKKCIFKKDENGKAVPVKNKEELIDCFKKEVKKSISDFPDKCWCCTHDSFKKILQDAGLEVHGIKLLCGNIAPLIKYWECEECKNCTEKKDCYIPQYIEENKSKKIKKCEGPCIIINPNKINK